MQTNANAPLPFPAIWELAAFDSVVSPSMHAGGLVVLFRVWAYARVCILSISDTLKIKIRDSDLILVSC